MHHRLQHPLRRFTCLIGLTAAPLVASSSTWTIHADGTGDYPTIQEAIDHAATGDTILVTPGRYPAHLWIESKSIVLVSTEGPEATILTGEGRRDAGPVVHFFFEEASGSVIEGFTIEDGETGIQCTSASPLIYGNLIRRNQSALGAGVCCIFGSRARIVENRIVENRTSYHCCFPSRGGGIYADEDSAVLVRGNLIAGNRCAGECLGGGISCFVGEIQGNTIVGNASDGPGGGVELPYLGVTFFGNIVAWNRSAEFGDGIVVFRSADLFCNDFWANGEEDYWGVEPGDGDFSADPLFCGFPGAGRLDPAIYDSSSFELRAGSPCIEGHHPDGIACGGIGAYLEGCSKRGIATAGGTNAVPSKIRIFPNPMRGATSIRLAQGPGAESPIAEIFNAAGRRVARLHPEPSGFAHWQGRTDAGDLVPAGIYFVRLSPGSFPAGSILVVR